MINWRDLAIADGGFPTQEEAELRLELQDWLKNKNDSPKFLAGLCVLLDMERSRELTRALSADQIDTQGLKSRLHAISRITSLLVSLLPNEKQGALEHERRIRISAGDW
jgi:hypothetical protein